jgi:ABC-type nitrate/sulfonate/bicarbonate transport system substrate-binding protein
VLLQAAVTHASAADPLPTLKVTVFSPPSQSIWIPTLIQELGLDKKHGFRLEVTPKPSKIAYADFASGADITLLWNIFNFDAFIVTNVPAIKVPKDIEGRSLQAETITGAWALGSWFLQAHGVNLGKVQLQPTAGRGAAQIVELQLKRVDAVLMNATEASAAIVMSPDSLHAVGLFDPALWKRRSGADALPNIAFGVWRNWYAKPQNQDLARRFYAANLDAQRYSRANPTDAAKRVAGPARIDTGALLDTFTRLQHLINVRPISDYRSTIAVLTQKLQPESKQLPQPFTHAELHDFVSDFKP